MYSYILKKKRNNNFILAYCLALDTMSPQSGRSILRRENIRKEIGALVETTPSPSPAHYVHTR